MRLAHPPWKKACLLGPDRNLADFLDHLEVVGSSLAMLRVRTVAQAYRDPPAGPAVMNMVMG